MRGSEKLEKVTCAIEKERNVVRGREILIPIDFEKLEIDYF